ncbi:MAG: hypothetical protein PHN19_05960 [Patescibacteria group bacterium]|nr:hypothetical protein [Patescibacteria group bacterium]
MEKNCKKFRFIYFDRYGDKLFSVVMEREFNLRQAIGISQYLCLGNNGQFSIEVEELEEESQDKKINKKKVEQNNRRIANELQSNPSSFYNKKNSSSSGRRF